MVLTQCLEQCQSLFLLILTSRKWGCAPKCQAWCLWYQACHPVGADPLQWALNFQSCWTWTWWWLTSGTSHREFCKAFGRLTSHSDLNTGFYTWLSFQDYLKHARQKTLLKTSEWHNTFVQHFMVFKAPYRIDLLQLPPNPLRQAEAV